MRRRGRGQGDNGNDDRQVLHGGNRGVGRRQSRGFQGELGSDSDEGFLVPCQVVSS